MNDVFLSKEEWQRLAAISSDQKKKALKFLGRWVHHAIFSRGFNLEIGPFSRAAMGGNAVDVICDECLEALLCGEVHWKPGKELKWCLVDIAKSKMGHIIRDYYNRGKPEFTMIVDYDDEVHDEYKNREGKEKQIAAQWIFEAEMRDMGYDIARNAVKNHPELIAYLDAMYKIDSYYGIASLLDVDVKVVYKLEAKLLGILAKM